MEQQNNIPQTPADETTAEVVDATFVQPAEVIPANLVAQPESTSITRLTAESLSHFSPEDQAEILDLAQKIDPWQIDKILSFGSIPLVRTYDAAGDVLQKAQGTTADQRVIDEVLQLSKEANKTQQGLNLALEEPNFFEKILLKIMKRKANERAEDVVIRAVTCYRLLTQLKQANSNWLEELREGYALIDASIAQDFASACEVDKYVVAGLIAQERIDGELRLRETKMLETGLASDKMDYVGYKEGADAFATVLGNLQKVRGAYELSIGQLLATRKINKTLQIAIHSQKDHNLTVAAQQLRNAMIDARHREASEGAKSVTALNSALMQKVSANIALTADEAGALLRDGVFSVEAALSAAKTVVSACTTIEKAADDARRTVSQDLDKLQAVMSELAPYVDDQRSKLETANGSSPTSTSGKSGLSF